MHVGAGTFLPVKAEVTAEHVMHSEWCSISRDVAEEVNRLKQQPGGEIVQYGVGELTYTLLRRGLVDELRFLVYPFALGSGQRVFEGVDTTTLRLLDTRTFDTGVVVLRYQPQRQT